MTDLQPILLSLLVNGTHLDAVGHGCKVVVVARAPAVEEYPAGPANSVEVVPWFLSVARSYHFPWLLTSVLDFKVLRMDSSERHVSMKVFML